MKNLLDHFRRKPAPPAQEPGVAPPAKPKAVAIEPARLKPARVVKPAWHTPAAPFPQNPRTPGPAERAAAALPAELVTLRLGDFLEHLPKELLDAGEHDSATPLPFELASLSERIGRGEASIRVTEIFRRMPDIFRSDAAIHPDRLMAFPWKRLLAMMQEAQAGAADAGISRAGVEALAEKFKARKLRQPSKMAPTPQPTGGTEAGPVPAVEKKAAAPVAGIRLLAPVQPAVAAAPDRAPEVAQLRAELEAALTRAAEFGAEYDVSIARTGELTAERDAAVARAAELVAGHAAAVARVAELTAEHDAAKGRAAELTAERDAATARTTELTEERAAAAARIEKLVADSHAAVNRAVELTTGHEAATARTAALTAERDAALARAAELTAEREAALARAAEPAAEQVAALTQLAAVSAERDAALARATSLALDLEAAVALADEAIAERNTAAARVSELAKERDAEFARAAELTAERDAVVQSAADRPEAGPVAPAPTATPEEAAWGTRIVAQFEADIEAYRNTIQALLRERDELRQRGGNAAARPAMPAAVTPTFTNPAAPLPDAYTALFPTRKSRQRAAVLALALLCLGLFIQFQPGAVTPPESESFSAPVRAAAPAITTPLPVATVVPGSGFTLETTAPGETMTLLPAEPLSAATAGLR